MASGDGNRNQGKYGEDFSRAPTQGKNESRAAYNQRLKDWQRRRSMSGSRQQRDSKVPRSADIKTPQNPDGWMGKVIRALGGDK